MAPAFLTMFKFIAVCVLVMGLTIQQCDKGCLKCSARNECVFCDTTNNYYLSQTKCLTSALTNCMTLNLNGDCGMCASNYYLDVSTKKCVAVETSKQVANCQYYANGQACVRCVKGYFIKDGKCVAVVKTVDNCEIYSDDGKCASCATGFLFNAARDGCVASPNVNGCSAYSFLDCKTCSAGYIANANLYFVDYQSNALNIQADINKFVAGNINDWTALKRCQKILDLNCLVASAHNVCTTCAAGFFLTTEKTCRAYPRPIIEACQTYNSLITCSGCLSGYFLESNTKCTLIAGDKLITDCVTYDNKANTVRCVQCVAAKYLSGNTCVARVDSVSIVNCKATNPNGDDCLTCNENFQPTGDNKKCLPAIANCQVYGTGTTTTSTVHTCTTCRSKYYLNVDSSNVTTCIAGNLVGCVTYNSATVCGACDTSAYYLAAGLCKLHSKVDNCSVYETTSQGKCATCNTGFYPFGLSQTCETYTPIVQNCIDYNMSDNKCANCASGFQLKNDNTCFAVSSLPNCKTAGADGVCSNCSDKFALKNADKTCIANHDYILANCDVAGADAVFSVANVQVSAHCKTCKENSYPMNLGDYNACVSTNILALKGVTTVENCKRYSNEATPLCLQCTGTLYLNIPATGARTCVATCPATSTILLENLNTGTVNTCSAEAAYYLANCLVGIHVFDNAEATKSKIICIKAAGVRALSVALAGVGIADNRFMWRDSFDSDVQQHPDALLYYGVVFDIFDASAATNKHDVATPPAGLTAADVKCEIYYFDGTDYFCLRCKWGYTVAAEAAKTKCEKIASCNNSARFGGFSSTLNAILSCHACSGAGEEIVVSINPVLAPTTTFSLRAPTTTYKSIQCLVPSAATNAATVATKIDNCQIYALIYIGAATAVDNTESGCIACKSGYKLNGSNLISKTCVVIDDCDATKTSMPNRCSACSQTGTAGAVQFRAHDTLAFQSCTKTHTDNCLIADETDSANAGFKFCSLCKPGYYLNSDKRCERITLPGCSDATGSTFYKLPATLTDVTVNRHQLLKHVSKQSTIAGCDSCNSGYNVVKLAANDRQCVLSSYVQGNTYITGTKYIADCAKYNNVLADATPESTCLVCKNNKIPTEDGKSCVTNITSCKIAQNTEKTKCFTCLDTHVSVSGVCNLKSIQNCATYDTTPTVSDLLCTACANGFVLASNNKSCSSGKVFACNVYTVNQPFMCTSCQTGYSLISTNNSNKTYCLKINDGSNCRTLDLTAASGLQGRFYKCNSCVSTNSAAFVPKAWPNDETKPQSICMALNLVDKCISYNIASFTVRENTYLCTACAAGFFLNEDLNTCVARKNLPVGCTEYEVKQDKCKTCSTSTFISADATDCVNFPNGILGCSTYSNDTVCTSCNSPRFLSNNTCRLSTEISKCVAYSANFTCTACEAGSFLTNSTFCEQAKALNCFTYTNINTCEKCDPKDNNKGLKTDTVTGVTSCVDKNVANCDISTNVFPFTCITCKKGFFLGTDGACAAATPIAKCLAYDSANTCTKCEPASVLTVDRKACNDTSFGAFLDANCDETQQLATPACSRCNPGSFFANNACSSCTNNTFANGCFSCDPNNQTACFACRPGYYQTQNGNCLSVNPAPVTNNTGSSASIVKLFSIVAFLFALLF